MARFLIAVLPIPGHYFPNLAVAAALRTRGHEVAFVTGRRARAAIEADGFEWIGFNRIDEALIDRIFYEPQGRRAPWDLPLLVQRRRYAELLLGTLDDQVPDVEAAVTRWAPDVLVCDPVLWGPLLVLPDRARLTVAVFAYVPLCPLPGRDVAPIGLGLPPPRTAVSRMRATIAKAAVTLSTGRFRKAVNVLRGRYGLAPIHGSPAAYAGRLPLYLVAGTREFDYDRRDLPASVHYVGPCLWERKRTGALPAWWNVLPAGEPWVHVSEGTVHTQQPIVANAAARGLAGLRLRVIISTSEGDPAAPARVNGNVVHEHWQNLYLGDLLPRTGVLVTTGGAGTVLAGLRYGVPQVVIPTEWDKPEIASRVQAAGAGVVLAPRACTPDRVRRAVERVIGDPSYATRARALAENFGRLDGPAEAARLLSMLAASRTQLPTPNSQFPSPTLGSEVGTWS